MADEVFLDGSDFADVLEDPQQPPTAVKERPAAPLSQLPKESPEQPRPTRLGRFFFDLETVPDDERSATFGLPELPPIPEAMDEKDCPNAGELALGTVSDFEKMLAGRVWPKEWLEKVRHNENTGKKRDGIFKAIDKAADVRDAVIREHAARLKLLSTTPEYCRIASFSFAIDDGEIQTFVSPTNTIAVKDGTKLGPNATTMNETQIVKTIWDVIAATHVLVGYNIARFDIPVIYARSAILGVKPLKPIDTRSWGTQVVDLYDKRFPKGHSSNEPGKLKTLAALYGLRPLADGMDGGDVYELMQRGDHDEVAVYNASDVDLMRRLFFRLLGMFW